MVIIISLYITVYLCWAPVSFLLYKYVGKEITHTPGNLRAIPSGVLNRLEKLTSPKPSLHSEGVDKVYPEDVNALRKVGLAPLDFPTMGDVWKMQDKKVGD